MLIALKITRAIAIGTLCGLFFGASAYCPGAEIIALSVTICAFCIGAILSLEF